MSFIVQVHPAAVVSIREAHAWIAERSQEAAERWLNGLEEAILSLRDFPTRCGLAPEHKQLKFELRQFIYGKHSGRYRVLFVVRGNAVHILEVRHGARRPLNPDELRSP